MSGILAWRNHLFSAPSNKSSEGTARTTCLSVRSPLSVQCKLTLRWLSGDALTDNMGLPINSSMKTKEKVAALESYIQDLEVPALTPSRW
jgi:hypothetical protein